MRWWRVVKQINNFFIFHGFLDCTYVLLGRSALDNLRIGLGNHHKHDINHVFRKLTFLNAALNKASNRIMIFWFDDGLASFYALRPKYLVSALKSSFGLINGLYVGFIVGFIVSLSTICGCIKSYFWPYQQSDNKS